MGGMVQGGSRKTPESTLSNLTIEEILRINTLLLYQLVKHQEEESCEEMNIGELESDLRRLYL